jgi:AcrR family transcriptional regulator
MPMDRTTKRARSDAAKSARRSEIILAAMARLAAHGLYDVSMQDIANDCALTKPALYTYFTTREELFLAVYRRLLRAWMTDFNRSLLVAGHPLPRVTFDRLFVTSFAARPLLGHLTNHLTATLVPNLTAATIDNLRAETSDQLAGLRALLQHYGYADDTDAAGDLARAYHTILVGAAQIADWPPNPTSMNRPPAAKADHAAFMANCLAALACLR